MMSVMGQVVDTMGGNNNNPTTANQGTALSIPRPNIPFEVKSEPPDYDYHPSPGEPYGRYSQTSPPGQQMLDSILQMSAPWDMVKTMNQQMNCAVSNFLTSDQNQLVDQITQNLKYSTAGGVLVTETSTSLTTMPSVCEARPSANTTTLSSMTPTQALLYGRQSVPSPEELDIMANLQKALGVLDDPNLILREDGVGNNENNPVQTTQPPQHNPPAPPPPVITDNPGIVVTSSSFSQQQQQQKAPPEYSKANTQKPYSLSKSNPSPPNSNPKKVPLEEILQPELLEELYIPCGVQQDSLAKFNEFMKKSHQQLSQWIDYLRKESNKEISPNNTTLRAIIQTNNQVSRKVTARCKQVARRSAPNNTTLTAITQTNNQVSRKVTARCKQVARRSPPTIRH